MKGANMNLIKNRGILIVVLMTLLGVSSYGYVGKYFYIKNESSQTVLLLGGDGSSNTSGVRFSYITDYPTKYYSTIELTPGVEAGVNFDPPDTNYWRKITIKNDESQIIMGNYNPPEKRHTEELSLLQELIDPVGTDYNYVAGKSDNYALSAFIFYRNSEYDPRFIEEVYITIKDKQSTMQPKTNL